MSLKGVAQKTLGILNEGHYVSPSGETIELAREIKAAVEGTVLYTPDQSDALLSVTPTTISGKQTIEVTAETTQVAAHRLVQTEGCQGLVLLNYASARNPGGGFINGAKAQEEDLTRCSGLYPCLLAQPEYYEANRQHSSLLYTNHLIYSPDVPWFRTRSKNLLDQIFLASVITAPAPNAGQILRLDPQTGPAIEEAVRRRAGLVLAVARAHGHRTLLLGAWGCGVFGCRPEMVADAFGQWLESPTFAGSFDRVVFGIYDRSPHRVTLRAFQERFPAW